MGSEGTTSLSKYVPVECGEEKSTLTLPLECIKESVTFTCEAVFVVLSYTTWMQAFDIISSVPMLTMLAAVSPRTAQL